MKLIVIVPKSVAALLLVILAATLTLAAVPMTFTYQGRLTTPAGASVPDGNYLIQFVIYNAPTGGTVLWNNGYRTVPVTGGLFTYNLGDSTVLPLSLFPSDTARYLGIKVGADPELVPRVKLGSVPFAFKAFYADTANAAYGIVGQGSGWTDGGPTVHLTTLTDKVAIGTNGANNKLDVTMTDAAGGAGYFSIDNVSNPVPALYSSTDGTGHGIWGVASNSNAAGVYGTNGNGYGVSGYSSARPGVYGAGTRGVFGEHPTTHNYGYLGSLDYGAYGKDTSSGCYGILGVENAGVVGAGELANQIGVAGDCQHGIGVRGSSPDSFGVFGSSAANAGVYGFGHAGVLGKGSTYGVRGEHSTIGNYATLGELSWAIHALVGDTKSGALYLENNPSKVYVYAGDNDIGVSARVDTGTAPIIATVCSGALAYHGRGVYGYGDTAGYFRGGVRLTRYSGHPGGLTLHTETHNDPGRCGIFFSNNALGTFEGDDSEDQNFAFYSGFKGNRTYDAHLAVYGRNAAGWGNRIELYHNGTDGYVATDVGDIALMPNLNVGVGTATPGYKLDVAGSCHATSFPTSSDDRLKENIEPIADALEKIEQINGVLFDWNERYDSLGRSSGHREIGVIAQDVERVLPELVTKWGNQNYRAVDYGRLTAVLVEATKQLAKENSTLKAENAVITQRLDELQRKVERLLGGDK